jgi:hypothetical protein
MSCWVAPTLAADLWQIPLEQLMRRIASGEIPVRDEDGFLFVDVAPHGPHIQRPNVPADQRPPTYTPVEDEIVIVTEDEIVAMYPPAPAVVDEEMGPEDETASLNLGDWRAARKKNARTRIPPPPRRLSA